MLNTMLLKLGSVPLLQSFQGGLRSRGRGARGLRGGPPPTTMEPGLDGEISTDGSHPLISLKTGPNIKTRAKISTIFFESIFWSSPEAILITWSTVCTTFFFVWEAQ